MRVHVVQHVPFEGPARIQAWAEARGHTLNVLRPYADDALPSADAVEALVVLGGPMSVHDETRFRWLAPEKRFLRAVVDAGAPVLGICLGAQLLAELLGGKVRPGPTKEIGWHPVTRADPRGAVAPFDVLPDEFTPFHWHGETFDLPPGAVRAFESAAYPNQAFTWGEHVTAVQFHVETDAFALQEMVTNCRDDLAAGPFVQSEQEMRAARDAMAALEPLSFAFLDRWSRL